MAECDVSAKKTTEQDQHHHHHPQQQQQQQQQQHHHHHHPQRHQHSNQQQLQQQEEDLQSQHRHHHHHHQHHSHQQDSQHQEKQPHHHHHHRNQHHHHNHHKHHHQQQQHHHSNGEEETKRRTTVLIAMDGSPHSFYAFDWYMSHIHKAHNDVIVVHSSHSSGHKLSCSEPLLPSVMGTPSAVMSRLVSKEEEEVNRIAQMIKGKLTATGVRGKLVRLTGEPGPAIVELANEHRADSIVTGSRGMGTIKRALIGSVSDYILHHATCPVLVCRYKENNNTSNNSA